jgi:membrane protease YdiL (CAAX protease family)
MNMTTSARDRVTGRQLATGIGLSVALAAVAAGATSTLAGVWAPGWAHSEGLTVLVVAEVYLAVILGLSVAVGGRAGVVGLLALHRPGLRQLGWAMVVLVAAVTASAAVSLALSPFSGGPAATMTAVVRAGSDEARLPTATALTWLLIVVRVLFLVGPAEELFFRGALYSWLRRRSSVGVTIAATTVAFAVEHSYYPILLPLVCACGLAVGWVRHRTHSTVTTIAMHMCVDAALLCAAVAHH